MLRRLLEYTIVALLAAFAAFAVAGCTSDTVAIYPCDTKASEHACGYLSDEGWDAVEDAEQLLQLDIDVGGDSDGALVVFLTDTDGWAAGWHVPVTWRCHSVILSQRTGPILAHEIGHGLGLRHACEIYPENTCAGRSELRKRIMYPSGPKSDGYFTDDEREQMRRGAGDLATCL